MTKKVKKKDTVKVSKRWSAIYVKFSKLDTIPRSIIIIIQSFLYPTSECRPLTVPSASLLRQSGPGLTRNFDNALINAFRCHLQLTIITDNYLSFNGFFSSNHPNNIQVTTKTRGTIVFSVVIREIEHSKRSLDRLRLNKQFFIFVLFKYNVINQIRAVSVPEKVGLPGALMIETIIYGTSSSNYRMFVHY